MKAIHLVSVPGFPARLAKGRGRLTYVHLLLEDHQVLIANGIGAESLYLGPVAAGLLRQRRMVPPEFSGVRHGGSGTEGLSRPMVKRHRVRDHVARLTFPLAPAS